MSDVFISYARADRERALPIRDWLEECGLHVFFDAKGIDAGEDFPDMIDQALKSAGVVLGVWSKLALTRPWVKRECRVGLALGKLVPIALEELHDRDIPAEFIGVNYFDFCDAHSIANRERVLTTIRNRLTTPTPTPAATEESAGQGRAQVFRKPKIYISDCGLPPDIRDDVTTRLTRAGFDVPATVYSGMYLDAIDDYYEPFDVGIIGFGGHAEARWRHALGESQVLASHVYVYFEPVAMERTGYGSPVTGAILHLEDWKRRPQACFVELLQCVKSQLLKRGWTILDGELPDLEIVCRESLGRSVAEWSQPLRRAGFRLRDQTAPALQRLPNSDVGGARVTIFVCGKDTTPDDFAVLLQRLRRGTAVVIQAEPGPDLPERVREECSIFDLQREHPSKSVVGTDEWERMLDVVGRAVRASKALAPPRIVGD